MIVPECGGSSPALQARALGAERASLCAHETPAVRLCSVRGDAEEMVSIS